MKGDLLFMKHVSVSEFFFVITADCFAFWRLLILD